MTETMKAAVFEGHERIVLEEKPMPSCGPNDAIVKVSLTAICGTDSHIWREQYPVEQGRIVGHEPVGTFTGLARRYPDSRSGIEFWSARSRPAALASTVSPTTSRSARATRCGQGPLTP